jgi:hypothetical protein
MDKYKWDMIEDTNSVVGQILQNAWDANARNIVAGHKQSINIGERGIIIKSPDNPMDMLVIQSGMLAISNDGGSTWKHSVTAQGCIRERVSYKKISLKRGVSLLNVIDD